MRTAKQHLQGHDGDGKRVKKIAGSEETVFVYDAGGKLIGEYSSAVQPTQDARTVYTTNDHLGSPRINTDGTGQVVSRHDYHPFGEEIARTGYGTDTIRKQFTGYERDGETGLDFAQARMYTSSHGRFSQCDPVQLSKEHPPNPQRWNLYIYVTNNPMRLVDPDGRKPRVIDVFLTISEGNDHGKMAKESFNEWKKLAKEAKKNGTIINIYRIDDGTATVERFVESIKTEGRTTVVMGTFICRRSWR